MSKTNSNSAINIRWMGFAGLGLGWVIGLAVTPVLAIVLTPIAGLVASATAALAGIQKSGEERTIVSDVRPVAALLVAVAIGATFGAVARVSVNHRMLEGGYGGAFDAASTFGLFNSQTDKLETCSTLLANDPKVGIALIEEDDIDEETKTLLKSAVDSPNTYNLIVKMACED